MTDPNQIAAVIDSAAWTGAIPDYRTDIRRLFISDAELACYNLLAAGFREIDRLAVRAIIERDSNGK